MNVSFFSFFAPFYIALFVFRVIGPEMPPAELLVDAAKLTEAQAVLRCFLLINHEILVYISQAFVHALFRFLLAYYYEIRQYYLSYQLINVC